MLRAHEFFPLVGTVAFGQDQPVESFELVVAIKVDKRSRHNTLPTESFRDYFRESSR